MNIKENIYKAFPAINWKSLHETHYPRLRFRFSEENTLREIEDLITKIAEEILHDKVYSCFMLYSSKEILDKWILKSVTARGLKWVIETKEQDMLKVWDYFCLQYFFEVTRDEYKKINRAIVEEDFWIEPPLSLRCYYFDLKNKICLHPYDDRGMDCIWDSDRLKKIYEFYKDKIEIEATNI